MNGENTSVVWPTRGSRTANEQNRYNKRGSYYSITALPVSVKRFFAALFAVEDALDINRHTTEHTTPELEPVKPHDAETQCPLYVKTLQTGIKIFINYHFCQMM